MAAIEPAKAFPDAATDVTPMSNTERKRAINKKRKKDKRAAHLQRILLEVGSVVEGPPSAGRVRNITTNKSGGGKASRSRRARNGEVYVGTSDDHHPCGSGAPVLDTDHAYYDVVCALEALETAARRAARPEMLERKVVLTDNHGSMESSSRRPGNREKMVDYETGLCSFSECNLRSFCLSQITLSMTPKASLSCITFLDLSRNELWELPDDLTALENLSNLDLSRNWFVNIPSSIGTLRALSTLNMSSNSLSGTREALQLDRLQTLPLLSCLDISINKNCGRQDLADLIRVELPQLETLHITITFPRPPGTFVGDTPAERDATLLRSQLEPWPTSALRRRLVADFGADLPADQVPRHAVMEQLLQMYEEEQRITGKAARTVVRVDGTPIAEDLAKDLLAALRSWSSQAVGGNVERPSISATNYMILTAPSELVHNVESKNAYKSVLKLDAHRNIWNLAHKAMMSVDPVFAKKYTALAVTHGFQGSPHIDRQNSAAFYGLSLGSFAEGTGGICVECSARIVACVNTKNRLAKVDGRNPHWVAPYDHENTERHSLIFYQTVGEREPVGPAIFQKPSVL